MFVWGKYGGLDIASDLLEATELVSGRDRSWTEICSVLSAMLSSLHHRRSAFHDQSYLTRSHSINIADTIGCGLPSMAIHQFGSWMWNNKGVWRTSSPREMKWSYTQTLPPTLKTYCFMFINNEWPIPAILRGSLHCTFEQPVSNVQWIEPFFQIPGQQVLQG